VKFLDIDPEVLERNLLALGGKRIYDRIFRDRVFDFPDWRLQAKTSWVRLRDKGDRVTLSFKDASKTGGANNFGMEEIEVVVSDFDKTSELFKRIGLIEKFNEEKNRVHFELDGIDIDIDTWPLIPPYVEIEGKNWGEVRKMADRLGLDWEKRETTGAMGIYRKYGIEEKDYEVLMFERQVKRK